MKIPGISITLRLTILFSCVSTAVLLVLGLTVAHSVENHFVQQDVELMTGKLDLVTHLLEKIQSSADFDSLPPILNDALVGHHGFSMRILLPDGQTLFNSSESNFPAAFLVRQSVKGQLYSQTWHQTSASGVQAQRGIAALLPSGVSGMPPLLVAVAVDIAHHEQFMETFRRTLWLFVGTAAAVVSLLGWAIVRHGLAPLKAIRQGAAAVTANRLSYRLALDSVPVELEELATTLNNMLARLEESFQRLKDFSSDLAHELRTPISNLMTQTQVVLSRVRSDDEYRDVLISNAEEYERLARMISDMLFLAQSDNGLIVLNREPVDLANEVRELFDFFDALAEEKALSLELNGHGQVSGDRLMLRRALANLLSNAIRHSPQGSTVDVSIIDDENRVTLAIKNAGDPIPPEHILHIFDRFYRADPSRHRNGEGAGLGLAITRSIICAHGGEINVQSGSNQVCFKMEFMH